LSRLSEAHADNHGGSHHPARLTANPVAAAVTRDKFNTPGHLAVMLHTAAAAAVDDGSASSRHIATIRNVAENNNNIYLPNGGMSGRA